MPRRHLIALLSVGLLLGSACREAESAKRERDAEQRTVRVMRAEVDPCTLAEPCQEAAASVESISPDDPRLDSALIIDARESGDFESWSYRGARNIIYDFLEPPPASIVQELAAAGASTVVVYGDGDDPDTGEELARELAGYGVPNVFFLEGGAPALRKITESKLAEGD